MSVLNFSPSSHSSAHSPSHMAQPGFDKQTRKKRKPSSNKSHDASTLTPSTTRSSKYYRRASYAISTPPSPHHEFPPNAKLPEYPHSLPTPPDSPIAESAEPGLIFHIYKTSQLFSRKTYDITLADKRTPAFHVSFPRTALGFSSMPNILVQRGTESGPVIGEVRFRSMFSPDEIHLPGLRSAAPESTTVSSDGLFTRRKRVRFAGRDWFWKGTSSMKAGGGHKAHGEGWVGGHFKCTDASGDVCALITRTASPSKVGRMAITRWGLSDREIEGLVVTGLAVLEKEDRGSADGGGGD